MSGYAAFARYYDSLTRDVGYNFRANNIDGIIKRHSKNARLMLDLACGTGGFLTEFLKLGYDVTGADSSVEMLAVAAGKCAGGGALLLNQSMGGLDLYGTVDVIVCMLDSVNHLPSEGDVLKAFQNAAFFLNKGGLFIFDVNTAYKHREILNCNTFVYDLPEVFCCWQNTLDEKTLRVDIRLDFFEPKKDKLYKRESESFSEWYYGDEFIKSAVKKAGLKHIETLCGDGYNPPLKNTERLLYVTKKGL